jgi:hypothetical protein
MASYLYPIAAKLKKIEQDKLPVLRPSGPIAKIFPEMFEDTWLIAWEQVDNVSGITHPRGLNNAPLPVKPLGVREMTTIPGVYSDFLRIDERKMTTRRPVGQIDGGVVDISDLVTEGSDQLATREYARIDVMSWTLMQTGQYVATDRRGVVTHQMQYTPRTYNATSWGSESTATPLADFRFVNNVGGLGTSSRFGASATAYMTLAKYNQLIGNTNASDLGGKRDQYGATYNDLPMVNRLLLAQDLPQIEIVQEGYFDDNPLSSTYGQWVKYLQDNKVVVVGSRPSGVSIGNVVFVNNVNGAAAEKGRYFRIDDKPISAHGPRRIELHRGFNAGITIKFPSAIFVINC